MLARETKFTPPQPVIAFGRSPKGLYDSLVDGLVARRSAFDALWTVVEQRLKVDKLLQCFSKPFSVRAAGAIKAKTLKVFPFSLEQHLMSAKEYMKRYKRVSENDVEPSDVVMEHKDHGKFFLLKLPCVEGAKEAEKD